MMRKLFFILALAASSTLSFQACNMGGGSAEIDDTDIVPSGTYTGVADKVDPEEKEIYVRTDDGKMLELYFTDQTQLTRSGQAVSFDALQEGQEVEVRVEKKGKRLEPLAVAIVE